MTSAPSTRVDRRDDAVAVLGARGVDGDVAQGVAVVDLDQVDGADRAARVADRGGHAAEAPGLVLEAHADGERVLG